MTDVSTKGRYRVRMYRTFITLHCEVQRKLTSRLRVTSQSNAWDGLVCSDITTPMKNNTYHYRYTSNFKPRKKSDIQLYDHILVRTIAVLWTIRHDSWGPKGCNVRWPFSSSQYQSRGPLAAVTSQPLPSCLTQGLIERKEGCALWRRGREVSLLSIDLINISFFIALKCTTVSRFIRGKLRNRWPRWQDHRYVLNISWLPQLTAWPYDALRRTLELTVTKNCISVNPHPSNLARR